MCDVKHGCFTRISKESVIDLEGFIRGVPQKIEGATQHDVEVHVSQLWVVSSAEPRLPLQIEDASRPMADEVRFLIYFPAAKIGFLRSLFFIF